MMLRVCPQAMSVTQSLKPYRVLSEAGHRAVRQWVHAVAREPRKHHMEYWYGYAQAILMERDPSESVSIEMPGRDTASGAPELLILQDGHYVPAAEGADDEAFA